MSYVDGYFPRVARGVRSYPSPATRATTSTSSATAQKLGLGVLGLGEGRTALIAAERTTHVRAVAACDLDQALIDTVARDVPEVAYTTSYDDMLRNPDVDIVAIYTPDPFHATHVVAAFDAGKDVVCTKPLVDSVENARLLLDAGARTGRRLLVGQSSRFFEPMLRQRAAYERGELGNLELAEAHYIHEMDWYYASRPWVANNADWVFLGLSHPLDLLRWYLGPIATVHAFGSTSALATAAGYRGFDIYSVNMKSTEGVIGRALGHYGIKELPRARNSIENLLFGSAGTSLARYHDMQYLYTAPDGTEIVEDSLYELRHYHFNNEVHGMHYGEFANYLEHFATGLLRNEPRSPDLHEGIETFCLMEAVRTSATENRLVEVAELLDRVALDG